MVDRYFRNYNKMNIGKSTKKGGGKIYRSEGDSAREIFLYEIYFNSITITFSRGDHARLCDGATPSRLGL